jgi:hypothetical protein
MLSNGRGLLLFQRFARPKRVSASSWAGAVILRHKDGGAQLAFLLRSDISDDAIDGDGNATLVEPSDHDIAP